MRRKTDPCVWASTGLDMRLGHWNWSTWRRVLVSGMTQASMFLEITLSVDRLDTGIGWGRKASGEDLLSFMGMMFTTFNLSLLRHVSLGVFQWVHTITSGMEFLVRSLFFEWIIVVSALIDAMKNKSLPISRILCFVKQFSQKTL